MTRLGNLVPSGADLLAGIRRPWKVPPALYRRLRHHFGLHALNQYYHGRLGRRTYNTDGIDLFAADWDNLLVLDGCRYDIFERTSDLPGELEAKISRGSHTVEWLRANIPGQDLSHIVYVTGSPVYSWQNHLFNDVEFGSFHTVVDLWKEEWDDEYGTVLPEVVAKRTLEVAEEYPNKRLLIHFLQPHFPFIDWEVSGFIDQGYREHSGENTVWAKIHNEADATQKEQVRKGYVHNLEVALPHVERLIRELSGRNVVTADHGNMLGERAFPFPRVYWGHPRQVYVKELVKVPWLTYDNGDRKKITAGEGIGETEQASETDVKNRLRDLGYAPK